jgi:hypothetical protein
LIASKRAGAARLERHYHHRQRYAGALLTPDAVADSLARSACRHNATLAAVHAHNDRRKSENAADAIERSHE